MGLHKSVLCTVVKGMLYCNTTVLVSTRANDTSASVGRTGPLLQFEQIYLTAWYESQISVPYALRSAIFKLRAIFETSAPNDLKWPWTLKGQRYPMYVMLVPVPLSPKFQSVSHSTASRFWVMGHFGKSPEKNWEKMEKVLYIEPKEVIHIVWSKYQIRSI